MIPVGMFALTWIIAAFVAVGITALALWRCSDHLADRSERNRLAARQPTSPARFDPAILADLPESVRRYFRFTIQPGTRLYTVSEITMTGQFSLGTRDAPNYMDMRARQILAPLSGFLWKMRARRGAMVLSGSDSASWTRFWLMGLIPVARLGGNSDHARSAFGRYIAEAVFWAPAALLPGPGITWEAPDDATARVSVRRGGITQTVDIALAADGHPTSITFPRWSDANPEKTFRIQPFGGVLSEFHQFAGFTLPTRVEAGNQFGTDDYFPFFIVNVSAIAFPGAGQD